MSVSTSPHPPEEAPESSRLENPDRLPPLVEGAAARGLGRFFYDPPGSETTLFRVPALNVAFAVTSALLLWVTVWAIWQDHSRDWKRYNAEWRTIQDEQYRRKIQEEVQRLRSENLAAQEKELRDLNRQLSRSGDWKKADAEARAAENLANLAENDAKFHKSQLDAERYVFEEARQKVLDGPLKDTPRGQEELDRLERDFDERWIKIYERLQRRAEELKKQADGSRKAASEIAGRRDEIQKKIAALTRTRDQLAKSLRQVQPSVANVIRNAPLIPPYSPTNQIQKVVISDLTEPLNFLDVPRVDRCKTCHLNIDDPDPALAGFTDPRSVHGGKLFRSHPRLDLYLGAASPHPYEQFGCTICHYGDGHATSFQFAAHTPRGEAQKAEWEEKYRWEPLHHQDFPMLPLQYITSTCAKCHPNQDRIEGADRYNQGRQLVEDYGCFGCHKMQGFEKYRKIGPNLKRIAEKTDPAFLYRWIKDPPRFRPTTRMPRFFDLDNTRGTLDAINMKGELEPMDFNLRNEVEALALATYIDARSRAHEKPPVEPRKVAMKDGDPARGKETLKHVGCLGCHSIQREGFLENDHAPDLSSVGSKLKREWLFDWILEPRNHDPETRMPRLRIEEDEGGVEKLADIVAYLQTLRDPDFEKLEVVSIDPPREKILREIAYDYQRGGGTTLRSEAEKKVAGMAVPDLLFYTGLKLVGRYGCFGCHKGISDDFDKMQPIGTELTQEGSKEVDKLDFARWGHQPGGGSAIPHSKQGWFATKLRNTRIFDTIPKEVRRSDGSTDYEITAEIIQKTPEELLKMPRFSFNTVAEPQDSSPEGKAKREAAREDRIDLVVTFILSRLDDRIPLQKTKQLGPDEQAVEEGRDLIRFLGCRGCHRVGAEPRSVAIDQLPPFSYEVTDEVRVTQELERETWLAGSMKAGRMTFPPGTFLTYELKDENAEPPADDAFSVRQLLTRWWESQKTPPADRRLTVLGLGEGKVRRYFGDGPEARPQAPPSLRKEGERVNADWLFNFLLNVKPLRTWLEIRMPSFHITPQEAAVLVRWFKATAGAPYPPLTLKKEGIEKNPVLLRRFGVGPEVVFPPVDLKPDAARALDEWFKVKGRPPYPHEVLPEHVLTPESQALAEVGREMFQTTFANDPKAKMRLQCNSCHPAGNKLPSVTDKTSWGPDLGKARERLRPSWIARWVLDPGSYMPGTKMPNNFMSFDTSTVEGVSVQRPDYDHEVDAIVQYLMHMRELNSSSAQASGRAGQPNR
jgi:cbb3-type cytochrome oxidase cytochrome c subunit